MTIGVRYALRGVTVIGWAVGLANVHPQLDPLISPSLGTFATGVAVAGTIVEALMHVQRPMDDVWQLGREHGRREAIREARSHESVASLETGRRRRRILAARRERELVPPAPSLSRQGTGEWSG